MWSCLLTVLLKWLGNNCILLSSWYSTRVKKDVGCVCAGASSGHLFTWPIESLSPGSCRDHPIAAQCARQPGSKLAGREMSTVKRRSVEWLYVGPGRAYVFAQTSELLFWGMLYLAAAIAVVWVVSLRAFRIAAQIVASFKDYSNSRRDSSLPPPEPH